MAAPSTSSITPSSESAFSPTSSSNLYPSTSSSIDVLRDTFVKRIRSITHLKRSLSGNAVYLSTIQFSPHDFAAAFDNERTSKRTLRYSLLGLSLSSIIEISSPADLARALISLISELESLTDEQLAAMTSGGGGGANFGAQRPKMRSFFKTGKQSLKRSTAAAAISEFGTIDSIGSTGSSEQTSYLMAPNLPFAMDFGQVWLTLCDVLVEVYYKMLSFLPKEPKEGTAEGTYGTFPRASSPPSHAEQESNSLAQALSTDSDTVPTTINSATQELLLKADGRIKKIINAQVKDIDAFARQSIKDELASLDPLMKDAVESSSHSQLASCKAASTSTGLPSTSSTLPFSFTQSSSTLSSTPSTTPSKKSAASHFRRSVKQEIRTSQDSHHGHHQFNLSSIPTDEADLKSGRSDADVPVYPGSLGTSPTKES